MKKLGYNEKTLAFIAAAILAAMMVVPLCAWEAWTTIDEIRAERAASVHICEYCGSEVES